MSAKVDSPIDVERWFREQAASLWPAALGSLSLRHSPCVRENCQACRTGKKHPSYVLYSRVKGRRLSIYVPDELVPEIRQCLDNGRALQELLYEAARRYTNAMKHQRTKGQRAKK
jgi:hypothetical protein